ncbi:hypothetical protein NFHSH190041_07130 [Shewanella sp. NFH-SH190041]|uniref:DUF998 domain-containing protein n=1 Tax=Shewanella sp. NFH-SH190041 TaxID=2950245 RepID=UPI0021C334A3|nr:DUF998 domain-containing protein [Shewanella sp. NFH-SH190041]BDM63261.1 hypothetical protein NFHSH190041_07130 [Shewanella sp. NFH-SH190041]
MFATYETALDHLELHRLVIMLTLTGAGVSSVCVLLTLLSELILHGSMVFSLRLSQLGDYNQCTLAFLFNAGMLSYGICTLMSMFGLYHLKLGRLSQWLSWSGGWLGISTLLLGAFPATLMELHRYAHASMLVSTQLFCVLAIISWIRCKPYCTKGMMLVSILLFLTAANCLKQFDWHNMKLLLCPQSDMPHLCPIAINSWLVIILSIHWDILQTLNMRRRLNAYYDTLQPQYQISSSSGAAIHHETGTISCPMRHLLPQTGTATDKLRPHQP